MTSCAAWTRPTTRLSFPAFVLCAPSSWLVTDLVLPLTLTNTATLPANPAAISAIADPSLKTVQKYLNDAPYIQTYFDVSLPTSVGQALNEAVANFFAGKGSPEAIVQTVR